MTLVERLRADAAETAESWSDEDSNVVLMRHAAARIEALEAALRNIAKHRIDAASPHRYAQRALDALNVENTAFSHEFVKENET